MSKPIDLRSDTVTLPSEGMRKAMNNAALDDDVIGNDPTTLRLEEFSAELLGKERALFVPSGSMANQICIKACTRPGQQMLCSETAHVDSSEVCMTAAFSGVQPQRVPSPEGHFTAESAREFIWPDIHYFPETGMVSVENTMNAPGGRVFPQDEIKKISSLCKEKNIPLHLDGARLFNAVAASRRSASEIASEVDCVNFCLSKGLGAPVGSMVCGTKEFIHDARRIRQMLGGGMRQTGFLAAAGLYALENNIERLAEDHANARRLAEGLVEIPGISLAIEIVETNMVYFDASGCGLTSEEIVSRCSEQGVRLLFEGFQTLRLVTHLDVSSEDVEKVLQVMREIARDG
jgi:threonine aldolase